MKRVIAVAAVMLGIGLLVAALVVGVRRESPPERCLAWDDALDPACLSVSEIVTGGADIVLVMHVPGRGGWILLDGKEVAGRKPVVWPKEHALKGDPTIAPVLTLPCGHRAVRTSKTAPWIIE